MYGRKNDGTSVSVVLHRQRPRFHWLGNIGKLQSSARLACEELNCSTFTCALLLLQWSTFFCSRAEKVSPELISLQVLRASRRPDSSTCRKVCVKQQKVNNKVPQIKALHAEIYQEVLNMDSKGILPCSFCSNKSCAIITSMLVNCLVVLVFVHGLRFVQAPVWSSVLIGASAGTVMQ